MATLRRWTHWLDERRDWCFDLLRVYLGVGLMVKGWLFASRPDLLETWMHDGQMLFGPPIVWHYVVMAHLCGGLMLALGLMTRLAAAVQIPILIGAVFLVHLGEGLFTRTHNLEFALLVLFLLVLTFAHGSGRWSVDHYLARRAQHRNRQVTTPRHP